MRRSLQLLFVLVLSGGVRLQAQRDRISAPIDPARIAPLKDNLRPSVLRQYDLGPADRAFPLPAMTLFLKRSASQQSDLAQLLADQQNPASASFHQWLTPEEFADRFGLSANDIAATSDWLRSQGFAVGKIARSRTWIVFSGTAGQAEDAFHAPIHRYRLNGEDRFAASVEPSIPTALSAVVAGLDGLDDFDRAFVPHPAQPRDTSSTGVHTLAPDDIATIYDIAPLYASGINGAGQKIVLAGDTVFNAAALADVAAFRAKFNLPANVPQVVLDTDYPDPGLGDDGEAHLDIEWSGAIARNAQIIYVYSNSYPHAVTYAVDGNLAPVVSMSANIGCEAANTGATMAFYQGVAQQANAQGITWVNSGNDSGPAACDANGAPIAENGLSLRFPASVPEVTAVGGTEFDEQGAPANTYWTVTNTANGASARSYIPEMVWNDSVALSALWAGGGGASIYFEKPAWQTGPGVPSDGVRDLPDVAMAASFAHDGYNVIRANADVVDGGTSVSAPVFAGVLTLLNQYVVSNKIQTQPGLGNVNPTLYRLASSTTGVFHDVTRGTNIVACMTGTANCPNGTMGFSAAPGYDQASGLGSVDVANLMSQWTSQPAKSSAVVVSASQNPVYQQAPDAQGNQWITTLTLNEEAGVGTTLTGFTIGGAPSSIASAFASTSIPPHGSISATVKFATIAVPAVVVFGFSGMDASGQTWSQQISLPFDGANTALTIGAVANAASYQKTFAPGMLLYVSGTEFSPVVQLASAVPLLPFMGDVSATINGLAAPLDYVSPGQLNIQIPYEIAPGKATLTVNSLGQSASFNFTVSASAPGIFTAAGGALVPLSTGAQGATLSLFITGQGTVSPTVATGAAPAGGTPVAQLPAPTLPVSVTVGGVAAPIAFEGIPSGLVGTMQINFTIPANAPLGSQPVVVTVGGVASAPATLTVTK